MDALDRPIPIMPHAQNEHALDDERRRFHPVARLLGLKTDETKAREQAARDKGAPVASRPPEAAGAFTNRRAYEWCCQALDDGARRLRGDKRVRRLVEEGADTVLYLDMNRTIGLVYGPAYNNRVGITSTNRLAVSIALADRGSHKGQLIIKSMYPCAKPANRATKACDLSKELVSTQEFADEMCSRRPFALRALSRTLPNCPILEIDTRHGVAFHRTHGGSLETNGQTTWFFRNGQRTRFSDTDSPVWREPGLAELRDQVNQVTRLARERIDPATPDMVDELYITELATEFIPPVHEVFDIEGSTDASDRDLEL